MIPLSCNWDNHEELQEGEYSEIDAKPVLEADKQFSDMSRQIGIKKAFMEFMSPEGVLLRPEQLPLVGAEAINYMSLVEDDNFVLSWKPTGGEISSSKDMGFTYGVYELKMPDTTISGTYVNIWEKQSDGSWKYVLNNTNEGTLPVYP